MDSGPYCWYSVCKIRAGCQCLVLKYVLGTLNNPDSQTIHLWIRGVSMGEHKWPNVSIWLEPLGVTPAQITAIMIQSDLLLIFWSISCCAMTPFPSSLFLLHPPQKKPTLSRTVLLWGLVEEMLGSIREEEFFLLHLPKEKKSYLRILSHMMKWKIANRANFFLYWTKSSCYNKERHYFCFLVWWWHKNTQTIPLSGYVQPQELPSHITLQREVVTDGWTKGQQAAKLLLLQYST